MDNRVTGFASGIDIDSQVRQLMQVEREPLNKMQQEQLKLQYEMENYREVNREMQSFSDSIFDDGIIRSQSMGAKEATSSNESLVGVNASSEAGEGSYTISEVSQLASAAQNKSTSDILNSSGEQLSATNALADELDSIDGEFSFDIATVNADGEEVTETFTFEGSDSLQDVIGAINQSDVGVNAFYDEFSGQMSLTRSETGEFSEDGAPEMSFNGSFLTDVLNLDEAEEQGGQNAQFTMNGIETERRSNTFTENGVEFTLKDTFADTPVQANISTDTDRIVETITDFVGKYNEMIELIDGKLTEEVYRDYPPLTDEQREEMSESEQEKWDERSQSGLLARDSLLSGALDTMRQDMYGSVETGDGAAFSQLTEIGITTTNNYRDRGKLEVDEDKLRAAVEQDPQAVHQLFAADGDSYEEQGIAQRVRDSVDSAIEQVSTRAGGPTTVSQEQFTIGREMSQLDDQMSNFERRLAQTEERYWNQFTQMEQAIAQANNQSQMLMSQMGGMGMGGGM
ncbi:flagellar hook-associated protein 2 [Alteribacillus sp. HJP-4]|uniref:flagellar hook-associated protein 2 n=1 Tax=Alteribacillus sp. HJP-4 TaxID=2775394 RepID=UPI0035CD1A7A